MRTPRKFVSLLLCGCLAGPLGCGGPDDRPETGRVTGVVLLEGKPLPKAQVMFFPETGRMSQGETDENGKYELIYLRDVSGAKVGNHKVQITTSMRHIGDDGPPTTSPELVPRKYNVDSELTATVEAGDNTIDFTLEGKRRQ